MLSPSGADAALVSRMIGIARYRGPDHARVLRVGSAALGYARLAILDLTPQGEQPMRSADGRFWIVHNGEVYNYREIRAELEREGVAFRGDSDTEVIVSAVARWGPKAYERMVGMWADAIWDRERSELLLVRDRFGIKPLNHARAGEAFLFASEVRSLLVAGVKAEPEERSVAEFLVRGARPAGPESFFKGISQVPPGHWLRVTRGGERLERYWDVPVADGPAPTAERFREAFLESVRIHLRSDVPVGTCLSGGLDSSSIVCAASRAHGVKGWKAFTARFPQKEIDESSYVDAVLRHTGAEPVQVWPSGEGLAKELEELVWHQEEPFRSTSIYAQWCVMRAARGAGVTVLLDGQGGDELLAGYDDYAAPFVASLLKRFRLGRALRARRELKVPWGLALGWCLPPPLRRWARRRRARRGAPILGPALRAIPLEPERRTWSRDPLRQRLAERLMDGPLQELLHYEDRNSMAHSIEARVPFLDHRLVQMVYAAPGEALFAGSKTKAILREAMRGVLPDEVRERGDKLGFSTPESEWVRGALRPLADEAAGGEAVKRGLVDAGEMRRLISRVDSGAPREDAEKVTQVVLLEMWLRRFFGRPAEDCAHASPLGARAVEIVEAE
jgi:asparagine synthase (glutamine-hydrolysing)